MVIDENSLEVRTTNSAASAHDQAGTDFKGTYVSADLIGGTGIGTPNPVSGVTITNASDENGAGVGKVFLEEIAPPGILYFISWQPPGGIEGPPFVLDQDIIGLVLPGNDASKTITVDIDHSALPLIFPVKMSYNVTLNPGMASIFPNVLSQETLDGSTNYRAIGVKNVEASDSIANLDVFLDVGVTAEFLEAAYASSGFVQMQVADGSLFPASGYGLNRDTGEVFYYKRNVNILVVREAHRGLRGTSVLAGTKADRIEPFPYYDMGLEALASDLDTLETIPTDTTAPSGIVFNVPSENGVLNIGALGAGARYGIWLKRIVPINSFAGTHSVPIEFQYSENIERTDEFEMFLIIDKFASKFASPVGIKRGASGLRFGRITQRSSKVRRGFHNG